MIFSRFQNKSDLDLPLHRPRRLYYEDTPPLMKSTDIFFSFCFYLMRTFVENIHAYHYRAFLLGKHGKYYKLLFSKISIIIISIIIRCRSSDGGRIIVATRIIVGFY